jgi:hypothetical protein
MHSPQLELLPRIVLNFSEKRFVGGVETRLQVNPRITGAIASARVGRLLDAFGHATETGVSVIIL